MMTRTQLEELRQKLHQMDQHLIDALLKNYRRLRSDEYTANVEFKSNSD